jgi:hypothetical protein
LALGPTGQSFLAQGNEILVLTGEHNNINDWLHKCTNEIKARRKVLDPHLVLYYGQAAVSLHHISGIKPYTD